MAESPTTKLVAHVIEEGSRNHVLSYHRKYGGTAKTVCSERNCVMNASLEDQANFYLSEVLHAAGN